MTSGSLPEAHPQREMLSEWVQRDRESIESLFGMKLEQIMQLARTDEGKQQLLERMKQIDPSLNGNADRALATVQENVEQAKKKESFFKKMLLLPGRAVLSVGKTIVRHPLLTILVILATYGLVVWQLPKILGYLQAFANANAGNALGKAAEYLQSFLAFSKGTTGKAGTDLFKRLPDTM